MNNFSSRILLFAVCAVLAGPPLCTTCRAQTEAAEVTPLRTFPVVDGSYAPNILRRIHPDGSLRASVSAQTNSGTPRSTPQDANVVIDGSWATMLGWNVMASDRDRFQATVTLDLSEVLLINKIDIYWDRAALPARWNIEVAGDGKTYVEVNKATVSDVAGKNSYEATFSAVPARTIRINAHGVSAKRASVALGQVRAYLAPTAAAPTIHGGYSLAYLQGVRRAARPSAQAWKSFSNITTGHPGLGNVANTASKVDASYEVDLMFQTELAGAKLTFDAPAAAWEHGGKIEVSADEKGPWGTVVASERMGTGYYSIPATVGPVRLVRFTNRAHPEQGPSAARLVQVEVFAPVREGVSSKPLAQIPATPAQRVSAGIFDAQGELVRTLAMSEPGGNLALYWDGHDDLGKAAPAGRYEWRAIVTEPAVTNIGSVGDSGTPPYGSSEAMGGVHFTEFDHDGNLYHGVWFLERNGYTIRKADAKGNTIWEAALNGSIALAADTSEVYVSRSPISAEGEDRIYRFGAADGKPSPFPDGRAYIVVNTDRPKQVETLTRTMHDRMTLEPLSGLALGATHLYVGNYIKNRVEIFERTSGRNLGSVAVPKPTGVAVRKSAGNRWHLWVASADTVRLFASSDGLKFEEDSAGLIRGGPAPQALGLNPQGDELAVGDHQDGVVRIYRVADDGKTTLARQVGKRATPGVLGEATFRPGERWDVALNGASDLAVGDAGNRMLRIFNKSGALTRSEYSEFQPAPTVFDLKPDSHHMLSGPWEYEVNGAGKAQTGPLWYHNGMWRLEANWTPDDALFFGAVSQRVKLRNGEDYLFFLGHQSKGLAIYHLKDGRMRRSAVVGTIWTGLDQSIRKNARGALWAWRDLNGDGQMDWKDPDPEKVGSDQEGEIIIPLKNASGWVLNAPGATVNAQGTIWLANYRNNIAKLPLQGFDEKANPIYDFAKPQIVVAETFRKDGFRANNLRISGTGEVYALGFSTAAPPTDPYLWMGGREIRRYNPKGELLNRFVIPDAKTVVSFALDPLDPEILYTGNNMGSTWVVRAWSKDGLCLATATPDLAKVGKPGWIDGFMGMNVFSPDGKQRLLYGMDVYHGKSVLFRLGNFEPKTNLSGAVVLKAPG